MNYDLLNREDHIKTLALTVARNRVGAGDPIEDVLLREGVDPSDFAALLSDKAFKVYLTQYVAELRESGFSFAAKCRVLAEDAVGDIYHLIKDPEAPAAARIKGLENLVGWAGIGARPDQNVAQGAGFSITFNIPSTGATPINAQISVKNDEKPAFSTTFTPENLLQDPVSDAVLLPAPPSQITISPHPTVTLSIEDPWDDPVFVERPAHPAHPADIEDADAYAP